MVKSIQTHYLPRRAYLSFFECPDAKGKIFMYQRGQPPLCLNIQKAGREGNLYCFSDNDGNFHTEIEALLERVESLAHPILSRLNVADADFELTLQEWGRVCEFIAAQIVRTPSWLETSRKMYGESSRAVLMQIARNDQAWQSFISRKPAMSSEVTADELRRFALSGEYDIDWSGGPYFLGLALKMVEPITYGLLGRDPILLRSSAHDFITSDHPVVALRHPKSPPLWGKGIINSNFLFPIGASAALDLKVPLDRNPDAERNTIRVKVRRVGENRTKVINSLTIKNAERFLFANLALKTTARQFDSTEQPRRFRVESPPRFPFVMLRNL